MKSAFENKTSLNGSWTLFFEENKKLKNLVPRSLKELKKTGFKNVEAIVPGNFEIDLNKAGVIDDVFFGENPLDAQKRENYIFGLLKNLKLKSLTINSFLTALTPLPISI